MDALETLRAGIVQLLEAVAGSDDLLAYFGMPGDHPVRALNRAALALDNRVPRTDKDQDEYGLDDVARTTGGIQSSGNALLDHLRATLGEHEAQPPRHNVDITDQDVETLAWAIRHATRTMRVPQFDAADARAIIFDWIASLKERSPATQPVPRQPHQPTRST